MLKVVFDTNILVAGLRSKQGLSYQLLANLKTLPIELCTSVALVLEYEAVLKRLNMVPLAHAQIDTFLDFLCAHSTHPTINYLWRPFLNDPDDDMLLELAANANATIVTHNLKDFRGSETLGVNAIDPAQLVRTLLKKGWTL